MPFELGDGLVAEPASFQYEEARFLSAGRDRFSERLRNRKEFRASLYGYRADPVKQG
jgi:hypothetical protein